MAGTAERWSIADVAHMAKVTSRTLRHYDQIGLLPPAGTAANGYRFYGRAELERLQRILLLRELGLPLGRIGEVLAGQRDAVAALAVHREWLLAESGRMSAMAATVEATINALIQGETMSANELFTGFDENPYEEEAISRWGKEAVSRSNAKYNALTPGQKQAMKDESAAVNAELARCHQAGLPAGDGAVQAAVGRHYRWICFHWTPTAAAYVGLGEMYRDDPRFAANYEDAGVPVGYMLDAMKVYAAENLT
ncbi:MerR family transcriptional regulator [Arthrobacter sp. 35W]|uniref:MerR family transcriptional regulator n=1 Tax=Arthrobacter sp. 35W TaxID=1132441 RepID=UPI000417458C|nr:MerR family transcriptional regulator [Arthrobacter sp. 35W]